MKRLYCWEKSQFQWKFNAFTSFFKFIAPYNKVSTIWTTSLVSVVTCSQNFTIFDGYISLRRIRFRIFSWDIWVKGSEAGERMKGEGGGRDIFWPKCSEKINIFCLWYVVASEHFYFKFHGFFNTILVWNKIVFCNRGNSIRSAMKI